MENRKESTLETTPVAILGEVKSLSEAQSQRINAKDHSSCDSPAQIIDTLENMNVVSIKGEGMSFFIPMRTECENKTLNLRF